MADFVEAGPVRPVNTTTVGRQYTAGVVTLSNGSFLVAWTEQSPAGEYGVRAQLFSARGKMVGEEIVIDAGSASQTSVNGVTALADGGFAVSWRRLSGADEPTIVQVFDRHGAAVADATSFSGVGPLTALSNGNFVAIYSGTGEDPADPNATGSGVFAQMFSSTGSTVGTPAVVNTQIYGDQYDAGAVALGNGGFVVAWITSGPTNATQAQVVLAQRFDGSGEKLGGEMLVGTSALGSKGIDDVFSTADGGFGVMYDNQPGGFGPRYPSRVQIFDPNGVAVAEDRSLDLRYRDVMTLSDGTYAVRSDYFGGLYPLI